jgi:hypothetical protein
MEWFLLAGAVIAIVLSLAGDRATLFGPVICAWLGVAAGRSVALVNHYQAANDRVSIDGILPRALGGAAVGGVFGLGVRTAYRRRGRGRAAIESLATAALFGAVGAIGGWLRGDKREDNPPAAMLSGAASAGLAGAALGFLQWWHDRRTAKGACSVKETLESEETNSRER